MVTPRHGLIEQDDRRFCHQCTGELQELLLTSRKGLRVLVCQPIELRETQDLPRSGPPGPFLSPDDPRASQDVQQMLSRIVLRSEHQVLEDRHVAELVRDLPRLREAEVDDLEFLFNVTPATEIPTLSPHGALPIEQRFEERRLSRPIRTDQARN